MLAGLFAALNADCHTEPLFHYLLRTSQMGLNYARALIFIIAVVPRKRGACLRNKMHERVFRRKLKHTARVLSKSAKR